MTPEELQLVIALVLLNAFVDTIIAFFIAARFAGRFSKRAIVAALEDPEGDMMPAISGAFLQLLKDPGFVDQFLNVGWNWFWTEQATGKKIKVIDETNGAEKEIAETFVPAHDLGRELAKFAVLQLKGVVGGKGKALSEMDKAVLADLSNPSNPVGATMAQLLPSVWARVAKDQPALALLLSTPLGQSLIEKVIGSRKATAPQTGELKW